MKQHIQKKIVGNQNSGFQNIKLPLIIRQFPELLSTQLVSVQPVTQPQGIAFAMRYLHEDRNNTFIESVSNEENEEPAVEDIINKAWNNVSSYNSKTTIQSTNN